MPAKHSPRLAVFTAFDEALLEAQTTVRALRAAGVPVIPVTAMTLQEAAPIAAGLGLADAMILGAGGAIARWTGQRWDVEPCGPSAEALLDAVREIEDRSGASLLVHSVLPGDETAPFVIESGDFASIAREAAALGFSVRSGRRFLHLCRECDQGEALARLRDELRCRFAVAVGSTAADAELLARADIPIILPGPGGKADRELAARVPQARIAPAPGPAGWAAAVEGVWQELTARPRSAGRSTRTPRRSDESDRAPAGRGGRRDRPWPRP